MKSTSPSFPLSSAAYEADLVPASRLRLLLLAGAAGATTAGVALILTLPVIPILKSILVLLWAASGVAELSSFCRGMSRICRIRIRRDGSILGYDRNGRVHALKLLPGSVVLERVAWLRLEFEEGLSYGELLAGSPRQSEAWRRLLVIWRHQPAFGRFGNS